MTIKTRTKMTVTLEDAREFYLVFEFNKAAEDMRLLIAKKGFIEPETKERVFPDDIKSIQLEQFEVEDGEDKADG